MIKTNKNSKSVGDLDYKFENNDQLQTISQVSWN